MIDNFFLSQECPTHWQSLGGFKEEFEILVSNKNLILWWNIRFSPVSKNVGYLHRIQWMHHLNPQRWKWQSSWLPGLWNYLFYFHLGGFFNLQTLFILMVEFNFFWEETLLVIIFFVVGCWNTQEIKFVFTHSHVELSSWKSTSQCAHSCVRDKI